MKKTLAAVIVLIIAAFLGIVLYVKLQQRPKPTDRSFVGQAATLAGSGQPGAEDGPAASASFSDVFGIAVDDKTNVLVADGGQNNRIRRITPMAVVETIAGGSEGFQDGQRTSAQFNTPSGIALTQKGEIIVADTSNNRIRRIGRDGMVSTLAGSGQRGHRDGPGTSASFDGPIGVAVDRSGDVLVADTYNDCIRRIAADGSVRTVAGSGSPGYRDGASDSAMFDTPCGIAVGADGNMFVADTGNN